jgi:hypothetical protein
MFTKLLISHENILQTYYQLVEFFNEVELFGKQMTGFQKWLLYHLSYIISKNS